MTSPATEYVLGTGLDELERLGLQHRLWSDAAHAAWLRAGLRVGHHVLDVGSGPGHASFDLAQLVAHQGKVVAIDESATFIEHLNAQARLRGLPQLRGYVVDVHNLGKCAEVRAAGFAMAYARWVLCFVSNPMVVLRGVVEALAPGGRFVVHDYFNYTTMTAAPRRAGLTRAIEATAASWKQRGGDPDVAGVLPRWMEQSGLRVESIQVHQRVARANDPMFQWPDLWWQTYTPKLVAMGHLTESEADAVRSDLDAMRGSSTDFFVCPPVFEIVGVKP